MTFSVYEFALWSCAEIKCAFRHRIACSVQGTRTQEYLHISRLYNAAQGKMDKHKCTIYLCTVSKYNVIKLGGIYGYFTCRRSCKNFSD